MKFKKTIIFSALFMMLLSSCGRVKNEEYEEFSTKMNQIIDDFIRKEDHQKSKKNDRRVRRSFQNQDEIIAMLNSSEDYEERKIDIANAFEQSMYIPVIVGEGLVKYRKQSNFYNLITFYNNDGYVKVTNSGNETSTYIYIPNDVSYDHDTHYMYFDITYNNENDYSFNGYEISDSGNTEWAFYGDNTLTFIEYSKTVETCEVRYQNANLSNRIYSDETLTSAVREKIKNRFESINKEEFRVLKRDSQFVVTEQEADEIIKRLFPDSVTVVESKGIMIDRDSGAAYMYAAKGEERVVIPNNVQYLTQDFYIVIEGETIVKELYIPKSIIGIKDESNQITDVRNLSIIVRKDSDVLYLEKIEVQPGSTLFKVEGPLLTSHDGTALLYVMNKKTTELDLLKFNSFPRRIIETFCPKTILSAKTLKFNNYPNATDEGNLYFYFVGNNMSYNYHYELLEVHHVTNDTRIYFSGNNSIKHLVLEGDFEYVEISDSEEIVSEITLHSSRENAYLKGDFTGLKVIDIYNNVYSNDFESIRCDNIEKIVVHEGVTSFDLNKIQFDYYEYKTVEVELPSTLEYFDYRRGDMNAHIKISTKVNEMIFKDASKLKQEGYEVVIEDQPELNQLFDDYEFITYDSNGNTSTLELITYRGMESELYVPSHISGKTVTSFRMEAVTNLTHEELPNLNVLKKVHLPNTISFFDLYSTMSENKYHLEELYFDGTLEQFKNVCQFGVNYLLEIGFCDKIICNDQTLSLKTESDHYSYGDQVFSIDDVELHCTNVVVNKTKEGYIFDIIINGEKYSITLELVSKDAYSGVIDYPKHPLSVSFQTNGELSLSYQYASELGEGVRVIEFFIK